MSKASEYAARVAAADKCPSPFEIETELSGKKRTIAAVHRQGFLELYSSNTLTPKEALALAAWIIETFGEPESESRKWEPSPEHERQRLYGDETKVIQQKPAGFVPGCSRCHAKGFDGCQCYEGEDE